MTTASEAVLFSTRPQPQFSRRNSNSNKVTKNQEEPQVEVPEANAECYELEQARDRIFRTHPFYLDYDYEVIPGDVTLIAQLSLDRLHMVEELASKWQGPLSLGLYLSDAEADQLVKFVLSSDTLKKRRNVGYHVVYKEGVIMP